MFSATLTLKWIWQRCYNISWELLLRYFVLRTVLTRDISFGLLNQNCKKCLGSGRTFIWFLFPLRLFNPCIPFSNWKKQNPMNTKQTKKTERKKSCSVLKRKQVLQPLSLKLFKSVLDFLSDPHIWFFLWLNFKMKKINLISHVFAESNYEYRLNKLLHWICNWIHQDDKSLKKNLSHFLKYLHRFPSLVVCPILYSWSSSHEVEVLSWYSSTLTP